MIKYCWWCNKDVDKRGWHHETLGRICCTPCYNDPRSNFRKTYGPNADQETEVIEVKRARA